MNAVAPIKYISNERVEQLEGWMLKQPQASCSVRHIFGPGIYIRELHMPADTFAVGHWQKMPHVNVMLTGSVTVMNDDGSTTLLEAPLTFVGKPGRKVGYVNSDMIWQNIYATDETDIAKLEAMFLDKSPTYEGAQKSIEYKDDSDYLKMLEELGVSEAVVRSQSENKSDLIPFPHGSYKVKIGKSRIEGLGLIATSDIASGENICPTRIGDKRTPAGRYTNHSESPNAKMVETGNGVIELVALRHISGCRGGADGEEITVDYRRAIALKLRLAK